MIYELEREIQISSPMQAAVATDNMALSRGYIKTHGPINQEDLTAIAQVPGNIFVGSSIDIHGDVKELKRGSFNGIVYYSKTKNMLTAENKLLLFPGSYNTHRTSSAERTNGYIFVLRETPTHIQLPSQIRSTLSSSPSSSSQLTHDSYGAGFTPSYYNNRTAPTVPYRYIDEAASTNLVTGSSSNTDNVHVLLLIVAIITVSITVSIGYVLFTVVLIALVLLIACMYIGTRRT